MQAWPERGLKLIFSFWSALVLNPEPALYGLCCSCKQNKVRSLFLGHGRDFEPHHALAH